MPCDTVSTARIKLSAATTDRTALDAAVASVATSMQVSISVRAGSDGLLTLNVASYTGSINAEAVKVAVMQGYGKNVVRAQAKRFGWGIRENQDGSLQVIKARF